jgi:hypothetical protein
LVEVAFGEEELQQLKLTRQSNRLGAIAHVQFAVNLVQVPLRSADGDHEPLRNVAIREATCDQTQDFQLSLTERLHEC